MGKRIYLDSETSGYQPGQITQLSYIVEQDGQLIKKVNQYMKVYSVDDGAANLTGLTVDRLNKLSEGTMFKDRANEFYADLNGGILIGQNISFDEKFLSAELYRCGISYIPEHKFCTMNHFTPIMQLPRRGGGLKYPKLQEILEYLDISESDVTRFAQGIYGRFPLQAHDSRYDAMAVYMICKKLEKSGLLDVEECSEIKI